MNVYGVSFDHFGCNTLLIHGQSKGKVRRVCQCFSNNYASVECLRSKVMLFKMLFSFLFTGQSTTYIWLYVYVVHISIFPNESMTYWFYLEGVGSHHFPELCDHACDRTMCLLVCVEFPQPPYETFCTVNVGPFAPRQMDKAKPSMYHASQILFSFPL